MRYRSCLKQQSGRSQKGAFGFSRRRASDALEPVRRSAPPTCSAEKLRAGARSRVLLGALEYQFTQVLILMDAEND